MAKAHRLPPYALSSIWGRSKGAALRLVRRIPFISSLFICVVLVGIVVGVSKSAYGQDTQYGYQQVPPAANGVALVGYGLRFDLTTLKLTVIWNVVGCGTYMLRPPSFGVVGSEECDLSDRAVDIYFDGATTPTFSYDPEKLLLGPTNSTVYVDVVCSFEADHKMDLQFRDTVPFDSYGFSASAFVIEKATNKSVPIVAFAAGNGPQNFVVSSTGMPAQSMFTYDSGTGPITALVDSRIVWIKAKRSRLAKAFTLCLFIVNWALTVGSVYITLLALVGTGKMDPAVILLPVTLVLTIPTLRNLFVGSPPFGIYIDTFGFFLQMMIVAVSSMILLYRVAFSGARADWANLWR